MPADPVMLPSFARDSMLYEVNLRQYSPGGSFREFAAHLPRLKAMGAGILWLMPIHPVGLKNRKGSLGSYYSIADYRAIDPRYGRPEDFAGLVEEVHRLGMHILLDWVANHTAWDHHWTAEHPEYYERDEAGGLRPPFPEWEDVIKLDYGHAGLRAAMTDAMRFWVETFGIDGFRCDMAHLVPAGFWKEAVYELEKVKPVFMLAEAEEPALLDHGFQVLYSWKLLHFLNGLIREDGQAARLDALLEEPFFRQADPGRLLNFTSNHDENSWNGSEIERLGASLEAATVLCFTLPGMPLVYSGQEAGMLRRLAFFDKDLIPWKEDKMARLFALLSALKKNNPALWTGPSGGKLRRVNNSRNRDVFSFLREKNGNRILVLVNLSWEEKTFRLSGLDLSGVYQNALNNREFHLVPDAGITLKAWNSLVLVK